MSKKLIIGIAAGIAAVGGVAALIIRHYKKQEEEILDCFDECSGELTKRWADDDYWETDIDTEAFDACQEACEACQDACEAAERCCDYAEQILRELEEEARSGK